MHTHSVALVGSGVWAVTITLQQQKTLMKMDDLKRKVAADDLNRKRELGS